VLLHLCAHTTTLTLSLLLLLLSNTLTGGVEDYVHRIGRTGRGDATGKAHTFFTRGDGKYAGELIRVLKGANQEVPAELQALGGRGGGSSGRGGGRGGSRFGGSRGGGRGGGGGFRKKW
jgi:ATP-dependent RNA helicase DDX5/DBP2